MGLRRMPRRRPDSAVRTPWHPSVRRRPRVRQSRSDHPIDFVRLRSGIVVASAPRLAFDLATDLSALDHASVVEQLIQLKKCTIGSLGATARRLCHPSRPGSELFARTLLSRGDRPAAESHPEVVLADALRARGVPVEPQFATCGCRRDTHTARSRGPAVRWGIEIDVHPDHLFLDGTAKDKRRDRNVTASAGRSNV